VTDAAETGPVCPFCEARCLPRSVPGLDHLFRTFDCPGCHAQLKQPLTSDGPTRDSVRRSAPETETCPDCAFSDLHCFACDDPICEAHIRTFEKYARFTSPELGEALIARYGNRIYCPLCFQNAFNRYAREITDSSGGDKPKLFNIPVVVGLLIVFAIIMIGLRSCDAAKKLEGEPGNPTQATRNTPDR
jgi:hypothetical protein